MSHDTVCQLFCNRGFVPARSVDDHAQTAGSFHCDRTGTWQPTDHVPSCVGKYQSINHSFIQCISRSIGIVRVVQFRDGHGLGPPMGWVGLGWVRFGSNSEI